MLDPRRLRRVEPAQGDAVRIGVEQDVLHCAAATTRINLCSSLASM
jgi:hypothetical protein